jgi:ectoine hydroxylase-related dioxygenase (phytanoyl-CoA dioxygenase family)
MDMREHRSRSMIASDYLDHIATRGFAMATDVIGPDAVESLRRAVARLNDSANVRRKGGTYGVRNLLEMAPEVRELAGSVALRALAEPVLGPGCFAVRGIFFDKIPGANWKLAWHQDSVIAVNQKIETPGFRAWSQKAGVWQTEPPAEVMSRMLALRVHLDDCHADNGPLRVIPGSHRHGWLDGQFDRWRTEVPEVVCEVPSGGVLAMRPLLLHASSPAANPSHRRVIHLEYAADELPGELDWYDRV